MGRRRHIHPASRASIAGGIGGIVLIAASVMGSVPVLLGWPSTWPGLLAVLALATGGVILVVRHMSRHRRGDDRGYR